MHSAWMASEKSEPRKPKNLNPENPEQYQKNSEPLICYFTHR